VTSTTQSASHKLSSSADDIVIGAGVTTSGDFQTTGSLFVDGVLRDADVQSAVLSVSSGGEFHGTANVRRLEVAGVWRGDAVASEDIVLRSSASVIGRLSAPYIVVHRGANVSGDIQSLERPPEPLRAPTPPTTPAAPPPNLGFGLRPPKRGVPLLWMAVVGLVLSGGTVFAFLG